VSVQPQGSPPPPQEPPKKIGGLSLALGITGSGCLLLVLTAIALRLLLRWAVTEGTPTDTGGMRAIFAAHRTELDGLATLLGEMPADGGLLVFRNGTAPQEARWRDALVRLGAVGPIRVDPQARNIRIVIWRIGSSRKGVEGTLLHIAPGGAPPKTVADLEAARKASPSGGSAAVNLEAGWFATLDWD